MRKIRDRVWSGLLAILVILSLVPQPIFAESDPSLEIVAEYWGETESTFTIRCTDAANTTQITVLAAVYQKGAFLGCAMAESEKSSDGLFHITVAHRPLKESNNATLKVFLLDLQSFAPLPGCLRLCCRIFWAIPWI